MTDPFPTWTIGLSGARYEAALDLHTAATPPSRADTLHKALDRAHTIGLDRAQLTAIISNARPTLAAQDLARAVRAPRTHPRAPSPATDDGPGWWPRYAQLCDELRRRVDADHLELHQAIAIAAILAAPGHDHELACLIATAHLIVFPGAGAHPDMLGTRFQIACRMFHEATT